MFTKLQRTVPGERDLRWQLLCMNGNGVCELYIERVQKTEQQLLLP